MSLSLPSRNSELRDMFDIVDLAEKRFITLRDAINSARRANWEGVRSLVYPVLSADDHVKLVQIGPRGGRKVLWNFGKLHSDK